MIPVNAANKVGTARLGANSIRNKTIEQAKATPAK
jgi:hypothetical protein